jgi:hypothetical protein
MHATPPLRWTIIGCCWLIVTLMTGCTRWIELKVTADTSQGPNVQVIGRNEQVPLVMDSIGNTRNGSPQNLSLETEQRLIGTLREIGLFSHLGGTDSAEPPAGEKFVRARFLFDEEIDQHAGDKAWKSIVIGASMFILAPFIPLEYDYAAHVTLELERWDGQVKRYESQSAGTAHYQLFGATPLMIDELKGHVTESCLTALMQQMVHDTTFYTASSAPLLDRPIRSVSVKSKRAALTTPVSIPISSGK